MCVCFIFWYWCIHVVITQSAYQNDHQPSVIRIVVLKVKEIASHETKWEELISWDIKYEEVRSGLLALEGGFAMHNYCLNLVFGLKL